MKTIIDEEEGKVIVCTEEQTESFLLGSAEAFAAVSRAWLRVGWDAKYVYGFTWMGRPVIQLPEDLIRIQEVIYRLQPDLIIETGIAHGGSLIFYASLLEAMGHGRVIGVDIDIRPNNRAAIEAHRLYHRISLIEGDSIAPEIVDKVITEAKDAKVILVILDSKHTKAHVLAELQLYSPLVSVGSYIVAMDGIMEVMAGGPRANPDWTWNNPRQAVAEFVRINPDFMIEEPEFPFNEGLVNSRVTYWPDAFVRRIC